LTNSFDDSTVGITYETISNSGTYAITVDGAQGGSGTSGGGGGGGGSYDADLAGAQAIAGTHTGTGFVSLTEVSCFLEGTRIATRAGERAVETLAMGDLITTADGATVPVRWIGRRTLHADGENGYRFADPLIYLRIRIHAGALGRLPHRIGRPRAGAGRGRSGRNLRRQRDAHGLRQLGRA
jgi:hypothetical protein